MRGNSISRGMGMAAVAAVALVGAGTLSAPANAQTSALSSGNCPYWIDVATGQRVPTLPEGLDRNSYFILNGTGARQASAGGKNFFTTDGGQTWIDAATGQTVPTLPQGLDRNSYFILNGTGARQASAGGKNFALIPCPPTQASSTGLYLGGELVKNWGWVRSTERRAGTDVVTNQFSDRADPLGGGFLIGYKFMPWANNIVVSPFASFDFIDAPVNHTFAGGSYLGTTANFMGTFGVKAGPQVGAGVWIYGIAGISVLNETLNINFIPVSSSQSAWVAGGTVGFGGAFQPSFLQGFGHPVSVFAEYQHTWWQSANFNTPIASPLSNYNFARQDDVVKVGFTIPLGGYQTSAPSYPVKALPPK